MPARKTILWIGWVVIIALVGAVLFVFRDGEDQAPGADETAVAAGVIATLTAEARATPTPSAEIEAIAQAAFEAWARERGEPFRDVVIRAVENDGFFATIRVVAWFRPGRDAPWEERGAEVECRRVADEWQCDEWFGFRLTEGEVERRVQATATARARAAATATAVAMATMPAALRQLTERFGLEFVYVPPGEFLMGSTETEVVAAFELCQQTYGGCRREGFEAELPQHQVNLDGFWIGRTEVTNAQYRSFVEAGGYQQRELWTEAGWVWREGENVTQPWCWEDEEWNQPDHPVVCATWYEAVAYTRWLARETGLEVRLPTEAEWEKTARGTDGRTWPWGEEVPDGSRLNYCDRNCDIGCVSQIVSLRHQG